MSVHNYFTHASNHVLPRQLMNMIAYVFSYLLIDMTTYHWMHVQNNYTLT